MILLYLEPEASQLCFFFFCKCGCFSVRDAHLSGSVVLFLDFPLVSRWNRSRFPVVPLATAARLYADRD